MDDKLFNEEARELLRVVGTPQINENFTYIYNHKHPGFHIYLNEYEQSEASRKYFEQQYRGIPDERKAMIDALYKSGRVSDFQDDPLYADIFKDESGGIIKRKMKTRQQKGKKKRKPRSKRRKTRQQKGKKKRKSRSKRRKTRR